MSSEWMSSIVDGKMDKVQKMAFTGYNVDTLHHQVTGLHRASQEGHRDVIEFLIMMGATVDLRDLYQETPLTWAVCSGQVGCAALLLQHRANIEAHGYRDWSPLMIASSTMRPGMVALLLQHKADTSKRDSSNRTALDYCLSAKVDNPIENECRFEVECLLRDADKSQSNNA